MTKYLIIFPSECKTPSNLVPNRYSEQIYYLLLENLNITHQSLPQCATVFRYSDNIPFENVLIILELYQQIQKLEGKVLNIETELKVREKLSPFQTSFSSIIDIMSEIKILLDLINQINEKYQRIAMLGFQDFTSNNKLQRLERKYEQYSERLRYYERHLKKLELTTSILLTLIGILLGIVFG